MINDSLFSTLSKTASYKENYFNFSSGSLLILTVLCVVFEPIKFLFVKLDHDLRNFQFRLFSIYKVGFLRSFPLDQEEHFLGFFPDSDYFLGRQSSGKPLRSLLHFYFLHLRRVLNYRVGSRLAFIVLGVCCQVLGFQIFLKSFYCFFCIAEVIHWFPSILLWVFVIFPLNQVFRVAALLGTLVEDLLNLVLFVTHNICNKYSRF